jgi:hypothetical protein
MRKFVEQFEKAVSANPIILSSHIEKQSGKEIRNYNLQCAANWL